MANKLHFETLQLHVGQEQADPVTDSRAVPIYQTTSYVFHISQHAADRFGLADAGNIYGGSYNLLAHTLSQYGVETSFVNAHDLAEVENAIRPNTKAIYLETLGNPNADIPDLDAISAIAKKHGLPVIVDNTFGTPYLFRPLEHGANIVVHSATKFIGGHGSSLGGMIVDGGKFDWKANADKYPSLAQPDPSYHGAV